MSCLLEIKIGSSYLELFPGPCLFSFCATWAMHASRGDCALCQHEATAVQANVSGNWWTVLPLGNQLHRCQHGRGSWLLWGLDLCICVYFNKVHGHVHLEYRNRYICTLLKAIVHHKSCTSVKNSLYFIQKRPLPFRHRPSLSTGAGGYPSWLGAKGLSAVSAGHKLRRAIIRIHFDTATEWELNSDYLVLKSLQYYYKINDCITMLNSKSFHCSIVVHNHWPYKVSLEKKIKNKKNKECKCSCCHCESGE